MQFAELQSKYGNFFAPAFRILINGQDLRSESAGPLGQPIEIFNISINNTLDGADDFSFTINNPFKFSQRGRNFPYLDPEGLFKVGSNVEITIGYKDLKQTDPLMIGVISGLDISFPANGISQLTIKGFDLSHKMMKAKKSKNWASSESPITYSEIVNQLAGGVYSFDTRNVDNTFEPHKQLKQDRESDFEFIKNKLAGRIGFEAFAFRKAFYFRPPGATSTDTITTLAWGESLISFAPEVNLANQVSSVEVRGWDAITQKAFVGIAKTSDLRGKESGQKSGAQNAEAAEGKVVKHLWKPVSSQNQAKDLARAILEKNAEQFVKGRGECIGIPDILPGHNIELGGLGQTFSKKYYIEKTTHSISSSGYKTSFSVKENTL